MKKITLILIIATSLSLSLFGEVKFNYDAPFGWMSPEVMAQGGSYTAIASGFNSLMTNPAGFAMSKKYKYKATVDENGERVVEKMEKGEVTILSVLPWAMINPFTFADDLSSGESIEKAIINQSSSNGLGAGAQFGGGYVGRGFGFGLITTVDALFPKTDIATGIIGDVNITTAFVAGYAHKFELGPIGLSVGADIRPMWRIKARDVNINTILGLVGGDEVDLSAIEVLTGFAIGFDAGVIAEWEFISLGLSMRDIGHTRYLYSKTDVESLQSDPFSGDDYSGLDYVTPMTMRIGLGIHPDLGAAKKFIDPKIHAEYVIPMVDYDSVAMFEEQSFWANLNVGAEVKLLSFLALRAGYSGGYLSAGVGLDLYIMELNAAIFSKEAGSHAGSSQQMGASVELAFRF